MEKHRLLGKNKDFSTPARTPKGGAFQPGHSGKHATVPTHPGMVVSHMSHSPGRAIEHDFHVEAGKARTYSGGIDPRVGGKPKNLNPVPVHPASHRVTGTNEGAPTITTLSAIPDASNPNALDPTRIGKRLTPPVAKPGMKSRTSQHDTLSGEAHLQEAFDNSSFDDRMAHGRVR